MPKRQKLWIVTEPFYPEDEGVGYYMSQYAFGLVKDMDVSAITVQPSYAKKGTKCPNYEIHNQVEIFRCWATQFDRQRIFLRLINLLTMSFSMFFCMLWRVRRKDVVLVASSPPMLPFLAIIACFLKQAKSVIYLYDLYPDIAVVGGVLKEKSFVAKILNRVTKYFYQKANMIFVLGRDMQTLAQKRFRGNNLFIHYVPILVDTEEIQPQRRDENELINSLNLKNNFVVQLAGNLGFIHDVELFLNVAKTLEDTPDIKFLLFCSGKKLHHVEKVAREENRSNIIIHPRLPREKTCEIVNACDISFSSLFIPGMYGLASPSRTYAILAAGKPQLAITEDGTEVALLIQEEKIGWQVKPRDVDGTVAAIRDAYTRRFELNEMQQAARKIAETQYDKKVILRQMAELLTPLLCWK